MTASRPALLSAAACAGMFVFGLVMALLGAVLPALSQRLSYQVSDIGTLFLCMNLAMLACSSFIGVAMDRFGMKPPMVIGALLAVVALVWISLATTFQDLIPAVILLGIGGGGLNAATNTLVADLHDDPQQKGAALSLLGTFFGVGALFLPFCIGALLSTFGIVPLLLACAVLCGATMLGSAALRYPPPKQQHRLPIADMPRLLGSPLVMVLACLLFFESGVEFTLGGYTSTYLTRGLGLSVEHASWILSAFWASLLVARLVMSRALLNADPRRVLVGCALVASGGVFLTAFGGSVTLVTIGVCTTAAAAASIYPSALGIAGAAYRDLSGTVFGILFTVALVGGTSMPTFAGSLAQWTSLNQVFVMVGLAFLTIAALGQLLRRVRA